MAKKQTIQTPTRAELEAAKVKYNVKAGGWLENYLGYGNHYEPVGEDDEAVVIELLPSQAQYYVMSGQVEEIKGKKSKGSEAPTAVELPGNAPALDVAEDLKPNASLVEEAPDASSVLASTGEEPGKARRSGKA